MAGDLEEKYLPKVLLKYQVALSCLLLFLLFLFTFIVPKWSSHSFICKP